MKLETLGKPTLGTEVSHISEHGFWILVDTEEIFLSFEDFPWFKSSSIEGILNVQRLHQDHLYWPDLDVDLSINSVRHPEKYPLIAKGNGR